WPAPGRPSRSCTGTWGVSKDSRAVMRENSDSGHGDSAHGDSAHGAAGPDAGLPAPPGRPVSRPVVALGGGHGLYASLSALRRVTRQLTAVVTVADDGGSSGRLRREFGVLPPGDLRMALAAL